MPQHTPLTGQVAVVTGAARGIGAAVSHRLAALGAHVLLIARDSGQLAKVQAAIGISGGYATACPLDLRSSSACENFGQTLAERWKRCDILINNAGVGRIGKPLHAMTPGEWDETLETNLRAPFLMIRAVAPLMIAAERGHIVNISSLAGRNPLPNGAAYAASKWGLNGLTYSVAEELRPHAVRVSVIAPGSVNTSFGGVDIADEQRDARKIQPDDIADIVETLVLQRSQSFISEVLIRPTSKP